MVRINSNTLRIAHCWLLGGLFALGVLTAQAEEGRFYLGLGAVADAQEFTYGKTVYIPGGLTRNEFTSAEGDAGQTLFTLGGFGGYRWPLSARGGLHLGAEIDVAYHPNELKGHLEGTGYTWTDTWPEDWWLKRNYSYGLTLKLGGLLGNSDFGLYALTGLRGVKTEFSITETGCPGPDLQCPPSPLAASPKKLIGALALGPWASAWNGNSVSGSQRNWRCATRTTNAKAGTGFSMTAPSSSPRP